MWSKKKMRDKRRWIESGKVLEEVRIYKKIKKIKKIHDRFSLGT